MFMGYYNPVCVYGVDRFLKNTIAAGVNDLIVVDMPPRGGCRASPAGERGGPELMRLATPTTDAKRMPAVLTAIVGFVYYVDRSCRRAAPDLADVGAHVARIEAATKTARSP